jgi:hypothetical protein
MLIGLWGVCGLTTRIVQRRLVFLCGTFGGPVQSCAQLDHQWFGQRREELVRVRLLNGDSETPLTRLLPVAGRILHPESNRAEWAIVALDYPVTVAGSVAAQLCLRPGVAGAQVGDPGAIPVHVAVVSEVREAEGRPVYKLGGLVGQAICVKDE